MADEVIQDIAVKQDKKTTVLEAKERIHLLFNVVISLSVESAGIQWVQLKGLKENTEFAKNYINALCSPECKSKVQFPEIYFQAIREYKNYVERDSRAVVLFASKKDAIVQGDEISVAMATSAIEQRVKELESGQTGLPLSNAAPDKVEQEKIQSTPTISKIDPSLKEFAMKLGYTEEAIQQVLKKQAGKEVDQNILLRELINVSSPNLLQKGKPTESVVPSSGSPLIPHRSEVVARGPPALSRHNPNVIARSWAQSANNEELYETSSVMPRRNEVAARGPSAQFLANMGQPAYEHYESNFIERHQEEEPFLYNQVVGDSAAVDTNTDLRHIVIDGSNVAMSHGNQQIFSCMGIKHCIEYFQKRGHNEITVFVPQWRKEAGRPDSPIRDQEILTELEQKGLLTFTPSRRVNGRRIVCYDDRFIVRLADETDGVIVSNDNFRDLFKENPKWQDVIEQRILMYSFVNDRFMVPDDPLGRHGPNIDDFLRKGTISQRRICPYLRRCTYGLRCKYYHPERDPNRKEPKKQPDNSPRVQEVQTRSRMYNHVPAYPQQNFYHGMQYGGAVHHQGHIREGPVEFERHFTTSSPEALVDRDDTLNTLKGIFPDELVHKVMRENPKATLEQLAHIITMHL